MAFDFKKMLKESGEVLKSGAEKAQDTVKKTDFQKAFTDAREKSKEAAQLIKNKADETAQNITGAMARKGNPNGMFTAKGALQLVYLLMSADGKIAEEETAQLCEIGTEFDSTFKVYQDKFIEECSSLINGLDKDDYVTELQDAARDIINISLEQKDATIPVKLLLWNLLVMAFSDNEFAATESSLIRYIAKHIGVDKSIIPEMENSIRALMAIENEIAWMKSVDRPYSIVEVQLNELSDRKLAIMQGVQMLISE